MATSKKEILAAGKKRAQRRVLTFLVVTAIFLTIITVELIFLLRSPGLLIDRVLINGASPYEQDKISEAVGLVLPANCPCFIPRRSLLFYPRSLIIQSIHQASPRAGEVEMVLSGRNLVLNIKERKPLALWCQGADNNEQCFFLDKTGTAFSSAPVFSLGVFPEFFIASGTATLFSKPLTDLDLPTFLNFAQAAGVLVQTIGGSSLRQIEPATNGDLVLVFEQTHREWHLLVNRQTSGDLILANLKAVLAADSFKRAWQSGQNLDYLDLRFNSKVFYKFRSTP
jgi:hypothetical protein